jgi:hypothetical protein
MARPREFEEQVALAAAMQQFWRYGYEATSIRDLADWISSRVPLSGWAKAGLRESPTRRLGQWNAARRSEELVWSGVRSSKHAAVRSANRSICSDLSEGVMTSQNSNTAEGL